MEKRKARILIAEDEEHIRSLIRLIVTTLGAEVVAEAPDGELALSLYRQHKPDMVILDINMPKLDGISVLKQIMAIDAQALVVMLTSLNALDVVKECIDSGAWNYILKNTSAEELHKAISATWGEYMAAIRARKSL
jgi:two-component system chemotaxis response regulator CheY